MNIIFILFLILLTSLFDTVNQLLLKTSINALDAEVNSIRRLFSFIFKLACVPRVWIGFLFCCLSLFIWLFVLSKADLNFAFSADSMHYVFIAFSSKLFLKEKVGTKRWVGTILIVFGIILITWSNR